MKYSMFALCISGTLLLASCSEGSTPQPNVSAAPTTTADDAANPVDTSVVPAAQAYPPMLVAQNLYAQNYFTVVDDDNFHANYLNWEHYFPGYNWGTDGCSGPAAYSGYNDNFYWPCVQHDFGYRNATFTGNHNETARSHVDSAFQRHMNQLCSHYAVLAKPGCYTAAKAFFLAVRAKGQSSFH